MWHRIILFNLMWILVSCTTNKMLLTQYHNVKLTINTTKDIVYDTINVNISFENNTTDDLYFLDNKMVTVSRNISSPLWDLEILFQDTILMIAPIFDKYSTPTKADYILLKSGDKYTFNYNVDFRMLMREYQYVYRELSDDYGEYSMQLTYKDKFLKDKRAFRGKIESNVIKVIYKKG